MVETSQGGPSEEGEAHAGRGLKSNVLANFLGQGVTAALGLLLIPLYVRLLGPEAYALVGLYGVLQAWLVVLDLGTGPTLNREMALAAAGRLSHNEARDVLRTLEYLLGAVALLVALVAFAAGPWLSANWFQGSQVSQSDLALSLSLLGALIGLRLIESIYRSALLGLERQVTYNVIIVAAAVARAAGSVYLLASLNGTIVQFFLWQIAVSVATVVALSIATYRTVPKGTRRGRFSLSTLRRIRAFAGGVLVITSLSLLLSQTDKLALSRFGTLQDLGYYTACWTLAAGMYFIAGPVTQAWYPRLTDLTGRETDHELSRLFHLGAQAIAVLAGTFTMILVVFSEAIVDIWLGATPDSHHWAVILALLAVGTLLNGLVQMPYNLQLASGWTALAATANAVAAPIYIPVVMWGVSTYGAKAAALCWLLLNLAMLVVVAPITFRRLLRGQRLTWVLRDVLAPVVVIAIVGLFTRMVLQAIGGEWILALGAASMAAALVAGVVSAGGLRRTVGRQLAALAR